MGKNTVHIAHHLVFIVLVVKTHPKIRIIKSGFPFFVPKSFFVDRHENSLRMLFDQMPNFLTMRQNASIVIIYIHGKLRFVFLTGQSRKEP